MFKDQFFEDKEQYLKAERETYENESKVEDTLVSDTWDTIKLLFKSCLPGADAES